MANTKNKDTFEKWIEEGEVENNLAIVQSLAMQGHSIEQIAKAFNLSRRAMCYLQKKHAALKKAIASGRLTVVAICQNKLMERVTSGDTTAIIYALKVYGGEFFNDRKLDFKSVNASANQAKVQIYLPATDMGVVENAKEKQ